MEQQIEQALKQFEKQALFIKGNLDREVKAGVHGIAVAFIRKDGSIGYAHASLNPLMLAGVIELLKKTILETVDIKTERV